MAGDRPITASAAIVQIGKYYLPEIGGIENNVRQVAHMAAQCAPSVVICMRRGRGAEELFDDGPVEVVRLRSRGAIWRQEVVASPVPHLRRLRPAIVHFHSPNPLMAFPVLNYMRRAPQVRLVISHHADLHRPEPVRSLANTAFRALLRRAERIISYTRHFAEHSAEIAAFQSKWEVIPHGVALPPCRAPAVAAPVAASLLAPDSGNADARLRVGFLGRIEAWKGVQVILDALAGAPDWDLVVAGDGGFLPALVRRAEGQGLAGRVTFPGRVTGDRKEAFFGAIDCLVLPSLNSGESYGQTLVEAQLRGIPVIASDLPTGVREICDFGRAGRLFPVGDAAALRTILEEFRNPASRQALAEAGRRHALANFAAPKVERRLVDFYARLLSSG